jgi:hypothetical protein
LEHLFGEGVLLEQHLVIACLDQLDCLSVGSVVALVDTHDPPLGGEGFGEVMQFEVLVAWIGVSDIVVAFGFAVLCIDLPGTVVAQLIHEAVLHRWEHHIINAISISRHVVLFFNVRVYSTTDSHHPKELVYIIA